MIKSKAGRLCGLVIVMLAVIFIEGCEQSAAKGLSGCGDIKAAAKIEKIEGPTEVYGSLAPGKYEKQVLDYSEEDFEIYHFTLPKGKVILNGYIVKPKGNGPFPTVIVNHGGYQNAKRFLIGYYRQYGTVFAKNGYVAVACDLTHTHDNFRKLGNKVYDGGWKGDALEENISRALKTIEFTKTLLYVDKNRIAMMGVSMGGFLTVAVAPETEDLKSAVVIVAGINPEHRSSPAEDVVKDISCPVLILNGAEDKTVGLKAPKRLKYLLDMYNKPSKLIIIPSVGHELPLRGALHRHTHQDLVFQEMFKFFDEHTQ